MSYSVDDIRIRDPFVFVENGKYYLIGTTGNDPWHQGSTLDLYSSTDLNSFEYECTVISENTFVGYREIWAPEIHKYNGKYYIIVSVFSDEKGRGSVVLKSDTITGPFVWETGEYITPKGWWCLDASLFVDNGIPYLFFSNEWIHTINLDGDGSLYVAKLSEDLTKIISEPKKIVSGKHCGFSVEIGDEIKGYVAEGPYVVKEDGKLSMYWSTFTEEGYCVVKSVSDDIWGEYCFDRFIFKNDGGHAMIFMDLGGDKRIVLHQPNISPNERMKVFPLK